MAGDDLNAQAKYYYAGSVNNTPSNFVSNVVNNLLAAITGSGITNVTTKGAVAAIGNNLNGSLDIGSYADPHTNTTDQLPRAYLTILYFDERFNFIEEGSTFARTEQPGDNAAPLVVTSKAPKNGYAYVYLSNENNDPVYFDDLIISHERGRIVEENHYYAYGLKIAGISSSKLGDFNEGMLENKNLYNDKELIDEGNLDWYDYGFRNYDAQIGRFPQLDPLTWDYPELTNYQYASNEPIANIDIDGLEGCQVTKIVDMGGGVFNTFVKAAPCLAQTVANGVSLISTANSAVRIGLDGVNTSMSKPRPVNNTQHTLKGMSDREYRGNNFLYEWKQFDAGASALYEILNPIFKTSQQLTHSITGQQIIRNLDGTQSSFASSRNQSDVNGRVMDFTSSAATLFGPALSEMAAAKGVTNLIPEGKLANHLFKGAGKLADNPANRSLIQNLANSKALGVDAFGKSWHMGLDGAGKSIYTYTQNGVVKGAGYATMTAEQMMLKYGLK